MCSLDQWIWVFPDIFYFLVYARSLSKPFFRPSQPGSCAWLSPFLSCADTLSLAYLFTCRPGTRNKALIMSEFNEEENRPFLVCVGGPTCMFDVTIHMHTCITWYSAQIVQHIRASSFAKYIGFTCTLYPPQCKLTLCWMYVYTWRWKPYEPSATPRWWWWLLLLLSKVV